MTLNPAAAARQVFSLQGAILFSLLPLAAFVGCMMLIARGPGRLATVALPVAIGLYLVYPPIVAWISRRSPAPALVGILAALAIVPTMALLWYGRIPSPHYGRGTILVGDVPGAWEMTTAVLIVAATYVAIAVSDRAARRRGFFGTLVVGVVLTVIVAGIPAFIGTAVVLT